MITEQHRVNLTNKGAEHHQQARRKARIRAIVALTLIIFWGLAAFSGFLLYLTPAGPRSGWVVLFLLTKWQWSNVHFLVSVLASIITIVHIAIDWKALKACIRYLISVERSHVPCD